MRFIDALITIVLQLCKAVIPSQNKNKRNLIGIENPLVVKEKVTLKDFEKLNFVGKGSYGKVYQVRQKSTGKIFAMKVVGKQTKARQKLIKDEKKILEAVKSPFLCEMLFFFEHEKEKYFVLEFLHGGDLFDLLSREERMNENKTRFYIGEIALALEYLHNKNIIYRDLKLENIMLDRRGHVKLTDFGYSTCLKAGQTNSSFCGTPEYMAPEIVKHKAYGHAVDIWALGIVMYELFVGVTPFKNVILRKQNKIIVSGKYVDPKGFSMDGANLLRSLLNRQPEKRPLFPAIKNSPFFESIDWEIMETGQYVPPFQPNVKNDEDVSQFHFTYTDMSV